MKGIRKLVAVVVMLAIMVQCVPVHAEDASVMSMNVDSASISLNIKNGVAYCDALVLGKSGTTSISGALLLKKGSTIVQNWKVGTLTEALIVSRKANVSKGTYKLTLNVNVFRGGVPETVNVSVSQTY